MIYNVNEADQDLKAALPVVKELFGMSPELFFGRERPGNIPRVRHIVYSWLLELGYGMVEVASACNRDRTTIISAYDKHEHRMKNETIYRDSYNAFCERMQTRGKEEHEEHKSVQ